MSVEVLTREDLQLFRQQLLNDFKALLMLKPSNEKHWLRSGEVRKMLNISAGTLQHLRVTGALKASKIGGINYYRKTDIDKLLENGTNSL